MSVPGEAFYSEDRWENWLDRLRDAELDPENEDSARLLLNLQDDVAIAVAKILRAVEEDRGEEEEERSLEPDEALDELATLRTIVLGEPGIEDEDARMLLEGVQLSVEGAIMAAEQYLAEGVATDGSVEEFLRAAREAEREEDLERAMGLTAAAGTRIVAGTMADGEGEPLAVELAEDLEYGLVTEWINGLDSLQEALSDPEVVEEE